ncbi:hypothetical protein Droror1_Dr00011388 [Drosera rotundifolia]
MCSSRVVVWFSKVLSRLLALLLGSIPDEWEFVVTGSADHDVKLWEYLTMQKPIGDKPVCWRKATCFGLLIRFSCAHQLVCVEFVCGWRSLVSTVRGRAIGLCEEVSFRF